MTVCDGDSPEACGSWRPRSLGDPPNLALPFPPILHWDVILTEGQPPSCWKGLLQSHLTLTDCLLPRMLPTQLCHMVSKVPEGLSDRPLVRSRDSVTDSPCPTAGPWQWQEPWAQHQFIHGEGKGRISQCSTPTLPQTAITVPVQSNHVRGRGASQGWASRRGCHRAGRQTETSRNHAALWRETQARRHGARVLLQPLERQDCRLGTCPWEPSGEAVMGKNTASQTAGGSRGKLMNPSPVTPVPGMHLCQRCHQFQSRLSKDLICHIPGEPSATSHFTAHDVPAGASLASKQHQGLALGPELARLDLG